MYKSAEQEKYFLPVRLQVIYYGGETNRHYQIVKRNILSRVHCGIVDYLILHREHDWQGEGRARRLVPVGPEALQWAANNMLTENLPLGASLSIAQDRPVPKKPELFFVNSRAEAVKIAQRIAVREHLPFDLQRDVLELEEALYGPELKCLACQKDTRTRGWEAALCRECKDKLKAGALALDNAATITVAIDAGRLIEYGVLPYRFDTTEASSKLTALLAAVAGTIVGPRLNYNEPYGMQVRLPQRTDNDIRDSHKVAIGKPQAKAMQDTVEHIRQLMRGAYAGGVEHGQSLLTGLNDGSIAPADFDDKSVEAARRVQLPKAPQT